MIQKFSVCVLLVLISINGNAQRVEQGFELMQVLKIAQVYRQAPGLSFSVSYTYADSAHPSTYLEQISGSSKVSNGKYWTMLDSVEMIQGNLYNLTVFLKDSSVVVSDPKVYGDVLKLPLLDSFFRAANVDSLVINEYNDSTRQLIAFMGEQAGYRMFKLNYDKNIFVIRNIQYFIKGVGYDANGVTSGTALITLTLSGYDWSSVDQSIFSEQKYVIKLDGHYYLQSPYTGFKLIINTVN